jgi:hypothetical protein
MGKALILLAICLLSGCSILEPKVDVGALARECMLLERNLGLVLSKDMQKLDCRR